MCGSSTAASTGSSESSRDSSRSSTASRAGGEQCGAANASIAAVNNLRTAAACCRVGGQQRRACAANLRNAGCAVPTISPELDHRVYARHSRSNAVLCKPIQSLPQGPESHDFWFLHTPGAQMLVSRPCLLARRKCSRIWRCVRCDADHVGEHGRQPRRSRQRAGDGQQRRRFVGAGLRKPK